MERHVKHFCCLKASLEKPFVFELQAELVAFFIEHYFYLKELMDKLWLYKLGYLGDIFLP